MPVTTFEGIVRNGQVRLIGNAALPENATVYVVVPLNSTTLPPANIDLESLLNKMPTNFQVNEEEFGPPQGKEVW
ncbi:MAG: hypothetical protein SFX18_00985 [Pirellulales bacterium]|nr:hypothetical protein [Pirellulales bacterium]